MIKWRKKPPWGRRIEEEFGRTISGAVEEALSGTGTSAQVLPGFTALVLPAGVAAVNPGALERLFRFVRDIKNAPGFTDVIDHDLGVLGSETPPPPPGGGNPPRIKLFVEQGSTSEIVRMTFFKDGHQGLHIESHRGTGAWEFLTIDTESPYLDERSLLVAGQAEVREYRARFWDRERAWRASLLDDRRERIDDARAVGDAEDQGAALFKRRGRGGWKPPFLGGACFGAFPPRGGPLETRSSMLGHRQSLKRRERR